MTAYFLCYFSFYCVLFYPQKLFSHFVFGLKQFNRPPIFYDTLKQVSRKICSTGNWHHLDNHCCRIIDTRGEVCIWFCLCDRGIWHPRSGLCSVSNWCKVMCTNSTSALTKQGLRVQPSPKKNYFLTTYLPLPSLWMN